MGTLTYPNTLTAGENEDVNELNANLDAIKAVVNGDIDNVNVASDAEIAASKLASADLAKLGIDGAGAVRRGKSIIATEESRTNVAYGTLTTPDQVANIVLPTDGLLVVTYIAEWKSSVANAGNAAIFVGANQVQIAAGNLNLGAAATSQSSADRYAVLHSSVDEALSATSTAPAGFAGFANTGQLVASEGTHGGPAIIYAAAGTYTISIQFKSTSGSVTVKNRKLWVWTVGF